MMKELKKLAALLLVLVMVLSVTAGCAPKDKADEIFDSIFNF